MECETREGSSRRVKCEGIQLSPINRIYLRKSEGKSLNRENCFNPSKEKTIAPSGRRGESELIHGGRVINNHFVTC